MRSVGGRRALAALLSVGTAALIAPGSGYTRAPPEAGAEMIAGKRVCVVMPAYNAGRTLAQTVAEIDRTAADDVIVVDDASHDDTVQVARQLGVHCIVHPRNRGYGGNQKTCYTEALGRGADIVVMVHPDYQYSPRLMPAMASMVASGHFDCVLGSRILGVGARRGGMPLWKYVANRFLTAAENLLVGYKLAEYHTGYRAFSRRLLETLPLHENSDDFVFDNQMLAQTLWFGFDIGELTCPTRYFTEASSINFRRSVKYGFGVLGTALEFRLARWGLRRPPRLSEYGRRLELPAAPGPRAAAR
ncbi:MAG TPA: glycosyltransferase family 2 protein [Anaeromyxobacteraceae bacterium]|nr:glycosyltransferase family 2 protein [Anaeromyxobacteraceae bacterium]